MPWLTREVIKDDVIKHSLWRVADFNESDDWEIFDFKKFHTFHKWAFINEVAYLINMKGFDIYLTETKLEGRTVGQFIDYVAEKQKMPTESRKKLLLP